MTKTFKEFLAEGGFKRIATGRSEAARKAKEYRKDSDAAGLSLDGAHDNIAKSRAKAAGRLEKIAAGKKPFKEGQDIQELSKKTLGSYIKKAHVSGLDAAAQQEYHYQSKTYGKSEKSKERDRHHAIGMKSAGKTGEKREQGINRAVKKLTKEDTTPLKVDSSDSPKEVAAKKKHNDAVKDIKEMKESLTPSQQIVRVLASDQDNKHALKEATFSALTRRAGEALDARKVEIAQNYFGQNMAE